MHCPNCRAALPANSRFCNHCGSAIAPGGQQPMQAPPPGAPGVRGPAYPQAPQPTQYPSALSGGYVPAMAEPASARRPVWLLAAAVALVLLLVIIGSVAVAHGFRNPVVANAHHTLPPS